MLEAGEIKAGMVLIFRYQGPKGAPGMPEMLGISDLLPPMRSRQVILPMQVPPEQLLEQGWPIQQPS